MGVPLAHSVAPGEVIGAAPVGVVLLAVMKRSSEGCDNDGNVIAFLMRMMIMRG